MFGNPVQETHCSYYDNSDRIHLTCTFNNIARRDWKNRRQLQQGSTIRMLTGELPLPFEVSELRKFIKGLICT